MKVLIYTQYGPPEKVLQIQEYDLPVPKQDEIMIKIVATAVNDYDWAAVIGKPYLYRLLFGLFKPKRPILGMELAGVISAVGAEVNGLKVGDAIYGDISDHGFGSFAEYICINSNVVRKIPKGMDMIHAAALPHASLLALQAFDKVNLQPRQKVLINGGGGGVGTFALQLAKMKNCTVTGVDSREKLDYMLSLGFDKVLDYKKQDFTKNGPQYDVILDCKTNRTVFAYKRALEPNGKYVSIGGKLSSLLSLLFLGKMLSAFTSKKFQILALRPNKGLDRIGELFTQNKLKCAIDGPHPFEELPRLIQYFGKGKHQGKIVVKLT